VTSVTSENEVTVTVVEAEKDAAQLLSTSWWHDPDLCTPLPIDPMSLSRGLGIRVREVHLDPDESGRIVIPETGEVVISLNKYDHRNRKRFTCAHELGHYIRRHNSGDVGQRTFTDYRDTLAGMGTDAEEIYANQFAAALLMPAHLVHTKFSKERWSAESLAQLLGTSTQALELRLRNLRLK
jgi:Zn-dependent peptidase ImmA (M78 family)